MPTDTTMLSNVSTIAIYLLVLFVPGLLCGVALGLRGWLLAGLSPLLTYTVGGLAGPWLAAIGLPFNTGTFAVAIVVFTLVSAALRLLVLRRHRARGGESPVDASLWGRAGHLAVLACLVLAALGGAYTVLRGLGRLDAIAQGFDAVYHANGIRYIADTGDGSLFGTGQTNWYPDAKGSFYPNAYHLISGIAYQISASLGVSGNSVPVIMNTNTLLLPGLLALSMIALVRQFRGRAVLAGAVALVVIAPSMLLYESMDRGPLLPFLLGLALTPLGAVALHRYLLRPALDTGFLFVAAAVGLLTVHSSTLFAGILFAFPLLLQRWLTAEDGRLRRLGRDLLLLLPLGVLSVLVAWLQLFGAIGLAGGELTYFGWPSEGPASAAVGKLLSFQHFEPRPQIWLSAALLLGFIFFARLGRLRWIGGTALLSGLLYVAVASSNAPIIMAISRPWWDDPYRFLSMATVPLCLIAAHGIAESQAWLRDRLAPRLARLRPAAGFAHGRGGAVLAFGLAAVLLLGFAGLSNGLYTSANTRLVATGYGNVPGINPHEMAVSKDEAQAMLELGKVAKPGDWAMNDRFDGSAWTYALSGVRTVAGHYDQSVQPTSAKVLAARFRDYQSDPEVREMVARLNVRWVIVGHYGYPKEAQRQPGLVGLDSLPFLKLVYRNADAQVYRLVPQPGALSPAS